MAMQLIKAPVVIEDRTDEDGIREDERAHFIATLDRAMRFTTQEHVARVTIYVHNRGGSYKSQPEWLEHAITVAYVDPSRPVYLIGAIQRTPGSDSEFHS